MGVTTLSHGRGVGIKYIGDGKENYIRIWLSVGGIGRRDDLQHRYMLDTSCVHVLQVSTYDCDDEALSRGSIRCRKDGRRQIIMGLRPRVQLVLGSSLGPRNTTDGRMYGFQGSDFRTCAGGRSMFSLAAKIWDTCGCSQGPGSGRKRPFGVIT